VIVSLADEVHGANFCDARLGQRLTRIVEELGARPNDSSPGATYSRAEMEGAYRFFDDGKVSPNRILEPHFQATRNRISQCSLVYLIQDTTELDVTRPEQQVSGAGPMDCEARRGAFAHPLMAFSDAGVPLGLVWQKIWVRDKLAGTSKSERKKKRFAKPIEEKESIRWIEGLRAAREVAQVCPETTCVCVGDSESDIYEMFCEPRSTLAGELHLLVRAGHNRTTTDHSNLLSKCRSTPAI
jgi:hypothetical protein